MLCRTGRIPGTSCSACSPREIIHDLAAWSVPQEKWPESLQIVFTNDQWWEAVEESLKVNLEAALRVSLQLFNVHLCSFFFVQPENLMLMSGHLSWAALAETPVQHGIF